MKNTKRRFPAFEFYDRTGIETYLENQAKQGWMLEKVGSLGWTFQRVEPGSIRFAVVYYPKASAFDPEPSEEQLRFNEFCEHTGWKLAASSAQMQIFYNEGEDPTPIETEALIEVENIHKSAKKTWLTSMFVLLGCGLLQTGMFLWRMSMDGLWMLGNNADLFAGCCWLMVILITAVSIIRYFRWHRKAVRAAEEDGIFVETKSHMYLQLIIIIFMLMGLAWLLLSIDENLKVIIVMTIIGVLAVTALVVGASNVMKKMKVSAKVNRVATVVLTLAMSVAFAFAVLYGAISHIESIIPEKAPFDTYQVNGITREIYRDDIPLTIEDMIDTEYDSYSYEIHDAKESLLLKRIEAYQEPRWDDLEEPDLSYTVTKVKVAALYDWIVKLSLEDFADNYGVTDIDEMMKSYTAAESEPWGANKAYRLQIGGELENRWLLCYDRNIVEIHFPYDWKVTEQQMAIVGEKLGTV